jgi:hypothetical protein
MQELLMMTDKETGREANGGRQIMKKVGYETEKKAALANSRITNQLYLERIIVAFFFFLMNKLSLTTKTNTLKQHIQLSYKDTTTSIKTPYYYCTRPKKTRSSRNQHSNYTRKQFLHYSVKILQKNQA